METTETLAYSQLRWVNVLGHMTTCAYSFPSRKKRLIAQPGENIRQAINNSVKTCPDVRTKKMLLFTPIPPTPQSPPSWTDPCVMCRHQHREPDQHLKPATIGRQTAAATIKFKLRKR